LTFYKLRLLVADFTSRRFAFNPGSVHMGYVLDMLLLGQLLPEHFVFFCSFAFHHLRYFPRLASGAGAVGCLRPKYQGPQSHPTLKIFFFFVVIRLTAFLYTQRESNSNAYYVFLCFFRLFEELSLTTRRVPPPSVILKMCFLHSFILFIHPISYWLGAGIAQSV
jgi:hypothetical protein